MATIDAKKLKNYTIKIPDNGGEYIILNSNNKYKIECGELTSWDCMEEGGNSLCLMNSNGTTIIIKNWFKQTPGKVLNKINGTLIYDFDSPESVNMEIFFSPYETKINGNYVNNTLNANNKNNTINPGGGYDIIDGKKGNDNIYFNAYNNGSVIYFNAGDGKDKIYNSIENDVLVFRNIAAEDLNFTKSGNNLVITNDLCKTDSVTIINYFTTNSLNTIYCPEYSGIVGEPAEDNNLNSYIERGLPSLIGEVKVSGSGKIYGTKLDDVITGSKKNDIIYASAGADDVYAGAGNDTIYTSTGGSVVDGGAGNDKIYLKPTASYVDPETQETIKPENVIVFQKGSGSDTIYGGISTDYIQVFDYTDEDLTFIRSGNNLVIKGTYKEPVEDKMVTKTDTLTLSNWFVLTNKIDKIAFSEDNENFNYSDESVNFADLNIFVNGTNKNDTLNAVANLNFEVNTGKGNDTINIGGSGTKIINPILGEGNITIEIDSKAGFSGNLILNYEEDKFYKLTYRKAGNDLIIAQHKDLETAAYNPNNIQFLTIKDFYSSGIDPNNVTLNYRSSSEYYRTANLNIFMTDADQFIVGNFNSNNFIDIQENEIGVAQKAWVYGGNKNDTIDTTKVQGYGVIITTGQKGKTDIKTGDYSDTVVVSNLAGSLTNITDLGGDEDVMEIYGIKKGDGISVIFDVAKAGSEAETHKDIILMTSSGVKKFFLSKNDPSAGVVIKNWFVSHEDDCGKFETIDIDNATTLIDEHIDIITKRVQAWLDDSKKNKKGHLTAMDVLERGTAAERNSLMAVYASENLGLELVENNLKNSTYNGTSGNDVLSAYNDDIILNGGKGNDKLSTAVYEDAGNVLYSGDYTTLNGGDGNDVLMGGFGSKFNGGKGNNVIHLRASGETTFISGGGADYIHFSDGTIGDLTFEKMGNDLYISSGSSFINVKDYFKNPAKSSLKGIAFSDTEVDYKYDTAAEIVNTVKKNSINITKALQISEGLSVTSHDETFVTVKGSDINGVKDVFVNYEGVNEKFYGYKGENYFEFTDNSGHDTIYSGKGSDTIYFSEVSRPDDLFLSRQGNNLIIRSITRDGSGEILEINSNSSLTIADYYKLKGKTSISEVKFGSSDETFSLSDIVKIATEIGNFADNVTKNVSISNADEEASLIGNDTIKGSVGRDRLYAGIGNDIIYTGHGDDEIYGGKGNDIFYGQGGVNTYHFRVNDGNDVIYAGKNDTTIIDFQQEESIQFSEKGISLTNDVNAWDWLPAFYKNGNDLVIYYSPSTNNNNNITLKDYFKSKAKFYIKDCVNEELLDLKSVLVYIEDNGTKVNGTSQDDCIGYSMEDRVNRTISSGAGDDIIYTGSGNSIIKAGDGDDEIYVNGGNNKIYGEGSIEGNRIYLSNVWENNTTTIYTGKGNDILVFEDVAYEDLDFSRSGNDMIITRYYGSEYDDGGKLIVDYTNKVLLIDYFKVNHSVKEIQTSEEGELVTTNLLDVTELVEPYRANPDKKANITGSMLKDVIYGTVFNDTINGANNDDTLYGDAGNDTLYGGTGNDVIYGGDGSDIIKTGGNTGSVKEPNDNYCDKIYGGSGNDKIYTESGYNRIYLSSGHGDDIIYMGKGRDDIYFDSTVEMNSLNYRGSGNNLVISYGQADENGKQSSITIVNYFTSSYKSVKSLIFESESCNGYDLEDYIIQGIRDKREGVPCNAYDGTADSNFIYLNSTSKKIIDCAYGSSYYIGEFWENVNDNDIIQSNSKWASLEGGYGNDTYIVNSLSNTTEINDVQGTDTIILNENKSNVNFVFNVYKEGCAPEPDPEGEDFMNWGMFIMNDSSLNKMLKTKMRANVPNTSIYDFFNQRGETPYNYNIETIQTKDGETVTSADLFAVKEAIASWLETKGKYDSAIEVLERGSSKDVNKLLQFYAAAWDTSKLEGLLQ